MVEVRLELFLIRLFRRAISKTLFLQVDRRFLQLIPLVQAMDVLQGLAKWSRHLLVEVLMMAFVLSDSISYKLVCACLLDVVVEPR